MSTVRPLGNWLLLRPMKPSNEAKGGLVMPVNFDKDVVTEGVAEVLAVGPGKENEDGVLVDHGVRPGNKVVFRGFLRYAQQVGEELGEAKPGDRFMMRAEDILAVVEGSGGTIGYYGEYVF